MRLAGSPRYLRNTLPNGTELCIEENTPTHGHSSHSTPHSTSHSTVHDTKGKEKEKRCSEEFERQHVKERPKNYFTPIEASSKL